MTTPETRPAAAGADDRATGPVPASARAVWRPVRVDGRVHDLVLLSVEGEEQDDLGLPPPPAASVGAPMSRLFPDSPRDGRLAAVVAVAEHGSDFRLTRPPLDGRPPVLLVAERDERGDVVIRAERRPQDDRSATATRDEQRWQRLFEDTPFGVFVLTLDGHVLEANRAACAILRRPAHEVVGALFHSFAHPQDDQRIDRELLLRTAHATMRKRYVRGDGADLWLRVAASLVVECGEQRMLSICEDVTEAEQALAELAWRAAHDDLTGLPSRGALRTRLRQSLDRVAQGADEGVGLLVLDLDRFKVVNDSLGHAAGDRLLREVAGRLLALVGPDDLLARLSGDEFAVVTSDVAGTQALAEALVAALEAPFPVDGREVTVGASLGIAVRVGAGDGSGGEPEEALLREADTAMYAAKRAGHGPVAVFEESLRRRALARLEDEQGLRRALLADELRVHYQPIQTLPDLRTVGYEALVRWQHPERGLLAPSAFLRTAEDAGLVVGLGRFVLGEACREIARRRRTDGALRVSVNVSAQHLATGSLHEDVDTALRAAGLEASALTLEVTEQALVVSHVAAAAALGDLRSRGCRIALDDFGTGYSSLAYLRQLPVDVLKIDRTFVTGAGTSSNDGALLSAIAALGRSLGLEVVTEGIETSAELAAAQAAGATHVQGFLLGRPEAP